MRMKISSILAFILDVTKLFEPPIQFYLFCDVETLVKKFQVYRSIFFLLFFKALYKMCYQGKVHQLSLTRAVIPNL